MRFCRVCGTLISIRSSRVDRSVRAISIAVHAQPPPSEDSARSGTLSRITDPARLDALRASALLDGDVEHGFDRLTRLAATVLDVPIALVTLVTDERQFFKSCLGLPEPWATTRETPLTHSFCQHAVERDEPLVISDAREHDLVRDNLAIGDLGVVAYLGIPLRTRDGHVLGSFCAIAQEPRVWSERDIEVMGQLAESVMTEIDVRAGEIELGRLYERERGAKRRAEQLQTATAALMQAAGTDEVLDVAIEHAVEMLGADGAVIGLITETRTALELRRVRGAGRDQLGEGREVPLSSELPWAETASTGKSVWLESMPGEQPGGTAGRPLAAASVPLAVRGDVRGVLGLSFIRPRSFAPATRVLLQDLAIQIVAALERATLLEAEQVARRQAEQTRDELRRIQALTDTALAELPSGALLDTLLDRLRVLLGADAGAILLPDEREPFLRISASVGLEPGVRERVRVPFGEGISGRAFAERAAVQIDDLRDEEFEHSVLGDAGMRAVLAAPLLVGGEAIGTLTVAARAPGYYGEDDVRTIRLAADRTALAINSARIVEQKAAIAETLQRSLLPRELPSVPGMTFSSTYEPARQGMEVGGDWYDVVPRVDGSVALVIGDVVGHGLDAAATMGMLRYVSRAYLLDGGGAAQTLARLDRHVSEAHRGEFATACICVIDPGAGAAAIASAGHPAPLAVERGEARYLEGGRGLPLGVELGVSREESRLELAEGWCLVLFTDGLVERRDAAMDARLQRLARLPAQAGQDADDRAGWIYGEMCPDGNDDDVAVLVAEHDPDTPAIDAGALALDALGLAARRA